MKEEKRVSVYRGLVCATDLTQAILSRGRKNNIASSLARKEGRESDSLVRGYLFHLLVKLYSSRIVHVSHLP